MEYVKYIYIAYVVMIILLLTFICILKFANLNDILYSSTKGTIVSYWGNTAPKGWAVCDGTNNTPDLRGRFIMGGSGDDLNNYQTYKNESDDDKKEKLNTKNHIKKGNNFQTLTTKMNINPEYTNNTSNDLIQKTQPIIKTENQQIIQQYDDGSAVEELDPEDQTVLEKIVNENFNEIVKLREDGDSVKSEDVNNYIDIYLKPKNEDILTDPQIKEIVTNMNDDNTFTDSLKSVIGIDIGIDKSNFIINPTKYYGVDEFDEDYEIVQPQYGGYKFSTNKTITADNNLPPYYALIYIIKL